MDASEDENEDDDGIAVYQYISYSPLALLQDTYALCIFHYWDKFKVLLCSTLYNKTVYISNLVHTTDTFLESP